MLTGFDVLSENPSVSRMMKLIKRLPHQVLWCVTHEILNTSSNVFTLHVHGVPRHKGLFVQWEINIRRLRKWLPNSNVPSYFGILFIPV